MKIQIAGSEFELIKKGRAQAEQLHRLGSWLAVYGADALTILDNKPDENAGASGALRFMGNLLGNIPVDAMLDLYELVIGCSREFAEENFDVCDLIDAGVAVYQEQSAIRRLVDRFFSTVNLPTEPEESSTTSELPMDGETTTS